MRVRAIVITRAVFLVLVCALGIGTIERSRAIFLGDVVSLTDQNVIGIPQGDEVTILLDLFPFEGKLKALSPSDRTQVATELALRATDIYLDGTTDEERAAVKTTSVALVYIRQRDEYNKPRFSSMAELGRAKVVVTNGKPASASVTGALEF